MPLPGIIAGIAGAAKTLGPIMGAAGQFGSIMGARRGANQVGRYARMSGDAQLRGVEESANALRFGNEYSRDSLTDAAQRSADLRMRGLRSGTADRFANMDEAAQRAQEGVAQGTRRRIAGIREAEGLAQDTFDDVSGYYDPLIESGTNALRAYDYELGLGDRPEDWAGLALTPQGRFLMEQGRDSIEAGASARGGLRSGATLQALEEYRQNLATTDRDNQLNRLGRRADQGSQARREMAGYRSDLGNALRGYATTRGDLSGSEAERIAGIRSDLLERRGDLAMRRDLGFADIEAGREMALGDIGSNWGLNQGNIGASEAMGRANALSSMYGNLGGIAAYRSQLPSPMTAMGSIFNAFGGMGGSDEGGKEANPMGGMGGSTMGGGFRMPVTMGQNALRFPGMGNVGSPRFAPIPFSMATMQNPYRTPMNYGGGLGGYAI